MLPKRQQLRGPGTIELRFKNLQIFNCEEHNTKCTRKDTISIFIIMLGINYMYGGTELYWGNENWIFLIRIIFLE